MIPILRVARPIVRDPDTPDEPDDAVDDEDLAMGSIVQLLEVVPVRKVERADRATGPTQTIEMIAEVLRTDRVEHHVAPHAAPDGFFNRRRELVGDRSRRINVGLEADLAPGAADRFEHRREDAISVDENLKVVAGRHRGAREGGDVGGELRIAGAADAFDLEDFLILRDPQDDREDQRDDDERAEARTSTRLPSCAISGPAGRRAMMAVASSPRSAVCRRNEPVLTRSSSSPA